MSEFELGGNHYRVGKMNAVVQFHIARKIAPIMVPMLAARDAAVVLDTAGGNPSALVEIAGPVIEGLSRMPDADADDVIYGCLAVVSRQSGPAWGPVVVPGTRSLQFEDLDLATLLQLVWKVLETTLGGFFPVAPSTSTAPAAA